MRQYLVAVNEINQMKLNEMKINEIGPKTVKK